MSDKKLSPETRILHTPYPQPDPYGALNMPVYHTAAYEFETAEQMEKAFTGQSPDHVYSRITNPTVQHFEDRVRSLTGAAGVVAFNSGMAAIANTLMAIAWSGCNIVTSAHLFGNTYSLLAVTLKDFGVEARFCDLTSPEEVRHNMDKNTCCVFLETITNPQMEVADLKALSAICRENAVPLIADTTIVPFTVFKANAFGVDLEIVSSTKYISGGATALGGLLIDYASFDWSRSPKLRSLAEQFGPLAFFSKVRREIHRNLGAYMTPQTASFMLTGTETLSVRYERATSNCLELVQRISELPDVVSVNYTGLPDNRFHEIGTAQFGPRPGAMFTFDLRSKAACYSFIDKLRLIKRATNLFDNKTLAIHPASTIFGTFSPETRREMDVSDHTIRISVGLENVEDLFEDFKQALL